MNLPSSPTQTLLSEKAPIVLGEGEQRLIKLPGLLKFSIGSPNIRSLRVPNSSSSNHQDQLLIKGIHPGLSDLWVWKTDGTAEHRPIRVEKWLNGTRNVPLEKALNPLMETEVIPTGRGVILRGEINTLNEIKHIARLKKEFPESLHDETVHSKQVIDDQKQKIEEWLRNNSAKDSFQIQTLGQEVILKGHGKSSTHFESIKTQLEKLFPNIRFENDVLGDYAPTVYFRVFLLELKRNRFHSLGLSWPSAVEGAFQVSSSGLQNLTQMDVVLQQLEGTGDLRILSQPELVVRVPGEAELFAGGELPIQVQSKFFSDVKWRPYGLTLKINVTEAVGKIVRLDILTEVSHLQTVQASSVPSIQANRMKTQVDAHYGIPLLLAGLLQQKNREEAKGLPFLRSVPVLGLLFGSEDYLEERSELVAILYPYQTPPKHPEKELPKILPRGTIPPARNWMSPEDERILRESPKYPWNALED